MISLLVAMDKNRVIGYKNDMPWNLPKDLKFFKETTTGHTIIMGRKTYESIGKPLPNRENVILSKHSSEEDFPKGIKLTDNIETVLNWDKQAPENELFVIGGEGIFKQFLPYADRMYITKIEDVFPGDTYFPETNDQEWQLISEEKGERNERNPYEYYFQQYDRLNT